MKSSSRWMKCISTQGNIRGTAIQATELVKEIAQRHELSGIHAQGLGEAVIGALLIASTCKGEQRVNLNIRSSGFCRQALVDANPNGEVRGYLIKQLQGVEGVMASAEGGPWKEGLLSVLKSKTLADNQPYIGTVPLLTGHLAKDLTFYWAQSEQIPSSVGVAVQMQGEEVVSAGGFLVQALPGASAAEVRAIEGHIQEIQSLSSRLKDDEDPVHLLSQIFQSTAFMIVEEKPLRFQCHCSWERVNRTLRLIGVEELQTLLKEDRGAAVNCDFCRQEYQVGADGLRKLIDELQTNTN